MMPSVEGAIATAAGATPLAEPGAPLGWAPPATHGQRTLLAARRLPDRAGIDSSSWVGFHPNIAVFLLTGTGRVSIDEWSRRWSHVPNCDPKRMRGRWATGRRDRKSIRCWRARARDR